MCPFYVGLANTCLEDLTYTGRSAANKALLKAQYSFDISSITTLTSTVLTPGRSYYTCTLNSKTYTLYLGTPSPFPVLAKVQPHLTQSNGLMFDGQDYLSFNVMNPATVATSDILTFGDQFTIEMWLRFTEPQIS